MNQEDYFALMQKLQTRVPPELRRFVEYAATELTEQLAARGMALGLPPAAAVSEAREAARTIVMQYLKAHKLHYAIARNTGRA